ncbi:alpha/beta hydrolase [Planctomyces sp. SH-PL62]|uniref:alpha/beta hydrolase n=1 Tax=Planctomyces sp. SH-PL62 TaxID=1636152 RepID=UPI00078D2E8A|nr:alpha/beta hydrolase [Planctomyces sp. SH-PL62]AMV36777.1 Phospholipase YtpA [Planctomyces sp. SH-PL62]
MGPIGSRVSELTITAAGGRRLKGRWWRRPRPDGVVLVAHGFGEHGGLYSHVAEHLGAELNVDVVAHDFHGHGRSPGRRGVVRRYEDLVDDLRAVASWARLHFAHVPLFLLGHSNGGQVALRYAIEHGEGLAGVVVSNPSIRLAMRVPRLKLTIGRLLLRLAPWATLPAFDDSYAENRDPVVHEAMRRDDLRHNRISPPFYFGLVAGGEMLLRRAGDLRTPLLLIVGGDDPIVDPASVREFFDAVAIEDKTLMLYPKMFHEPLNELGRERVMHDIVRWIAPRLG